MNMNQRKIGAILSYVNLVIRTILGLAYVPLLLYYIGKNEYGLFQLMGSVIAYFSVLDFGLSAAITRYYAKYLAIRDYLKMENIVAGALVAYAVVTIVMLITGGVVYFSLDSIFGEQFTFNEMVSAKHIFVLLLFNMMITVSTLVFTAVINAHERFLFIQGVNSVQLILQPFAVIAVMQVRPSAFAVVMVQTALNILVISARIYYSFFKLNIKIKYHFFDKSLFWGMGSLAGSLFIVTLVDQVFWRTNQVILGIYGGTAAVAVYAIAATIYMNYMAVSTSISSVFLPKVTRIVVAGNDRKLLSELFIKIGRLQYLLLAVVLSGFYLFGQEFIKLWAGGDFLDAYWITLIIICPFTIDLIQNIGLVIMQAQNNYWFKATVYFIVCIFNIIIAVPLAIKYGGIGCAIATGLMMFISNGLIMNLFYIKVEKIAIKEFWWQIGKMTVSVLVCTAIGFTFNYVLYGGIVLFICKIALYLLLYCILMWLFAMNDYEKNLVKELLNKLDELWSAIWGTKTIK